MVAQSYSPLQIVVIDSSPDDRCEEIVRAGFSQILYHHSSERLYPHEARNAGIRLASGELILSTDPDIYAPVDWVERLVETYLTYWGVIVGSFRNYGMSRVDQAIHLCKFDMWLPGGKIRRIEIGPTANILYPRAFLEAIGLFDGTLMVGDTKASWDLQALGVPFYFVPQATVEHHHTSTVAELLTERYQRGYEFAKLRMDYFDWRFEQTLRALALTLFPFRLVKLFLRTSMCAWRADMAASFFLSSTIILAVHAAWLIGEARCYLQALRSGRL